MSSTAERLAAKVARGLQRRSGHVCVIVFWFILAAVGAVFGPRLLKNVVNDFPPPKGSKSEAALQAYERAFPEQANKATNLIYIEAPENAPSLTAPAGANSTLCQITQRAQQYFAPSGPGGDCGLAVSGYCTLDPRLTAVAAGLVAMDGHASFIKFDGPRGKDLDQKIGDGIIDLVKELRGSFPDLFVGPFGEQTLGVEALTGLNQDLSKMDLTIPLAFSVMAYMVRSLRLMLLPLLCLGVSFITALYMVYLINKAGLAINSAAPTMMLSILTALSIDYALFLLTRFREEIAGGAEITDAIAVTLARSGKTIIGSGCTLMLCFIGLLAFPIMVLQSVGVAIVVAVIMTMAVNLTLMPACLLAFPRFFAAAGSQSGRCCALRRRRDGAGEDGNGAAPEGARAPLAASEVPAKLPGWYRLARCATSKYSWIMAGTVLLAVLVPGVVMLANMKHSGSTLLMVPRSADNTATMRRLEGAFPAGTDTPYDLLLQPKSGGTVYEEAFFDESRQLISQMAELAGAGSQVTSPMWVTGSPGNNLSFAALGPILNASSDAVCEALPVANLTSLCLGLRYVANSTVNAGRTAVVALIVIDYPMGSPEASDFTRKARDAVDSFAPTARYVDAQLAGAGSVYADGVDSVYELLPIVLGVTLVVVLSVVGLLYGSVGIGLRALLTITFTIAFSFGLGIGIYQYGWLASLGSKFEKNGAFAWLVPPITFSVVLGLALDYDIFLVGRVVEFRFMGFDDREAVQLGLWKTGRVITAAGLIMAIAFAGLLLSDTAMLNQSSVMLVSAVLVDTFVVRSLIVPAVMGVMGCVNWWPRRPAQGYRDSEEYVKGEMILMRNGGVRPDDEHSISLQESSPSA